MQYSPNRTQHHKHHHGKAFRSILPVSNRTEMGFFRSASGQITHEKQRRWQSQVERDVDPGLHVQSTVTAVQRQVCWKRYWK